MRSICPALATFAVLFFAAWASSADSLEDGDILVRKGFGYWAEVFSNIPSDGDHHFSHAGLVIVKHGSVFVINEQADNFGNGKALEQTRAQFLKESSDWAAYRLTFDADLRRRIDACADQYVAANIPLDSGFDLADSKRLYCIEMVWLAVKTVTKVDIATEKVLRDGRTFIPVQALYKNRYVYPILDKQALGCRLARGSRGC